MEPLFTIKNLSVAYGGINALSSISVEVFRGEIVAIIGSNGAGKSTLLRTISGITKARSGQIVFHETDITNKAPDLISSLGIAHVPEGRRVFANLTVLENLLVGAHVIKQRKIVEANLRKVFSLFPRLEERRKQPAGTLSGGEQQMLALGRALMSDSKLLLLDEPSLGLAPLVINDIFLAIKEINEEGRTILLVEQNAVKALASSNRSYVLETGNIVLEGPSKEIASNPMVHEAYLGAKKQ